MSNDLKIIKGIEGGIDQLITKSKQLDETILKVSKSARKVSSSFNNIKGAGDLNATIKNTSASVSELTAYEKERIAVAKRIQSAIAKQKVAEEGLTGSLIKTRYETQQLNQKQREAAKVSSTLGGEYKKQSAILQQLRTKYKDMVLVQGASSKAAKDLLSRITALDSRLKKVDASVGQFNRQVGNYGKSMRSAAAAARNMASAMGYVGGAFLVFKVVSDAAKRVRQFDKAMQNMAGITRTSRKDLAEVEKAILKVAGTSIKTSNEVAKLAENLFTLGKSKSEVISLLKPVNDLAIGLETTSGEAAEFLVQTLNAFGASSHEATEYADTIASIRTSTSLDFQKMRDSFQYITPISRILNKDLAYTGALVGVLADNGIKAESAGRLLGTAQQKLAKTGKTLSDGLDIINAAQAKGVKEVELLAIATKLFDKQSAKLGIILASNRKVLKDSAQAIRENSGALDDLTNQQLESLDAKLKILDSSWERFILSIENGEGAMSRFVKSAVTGLSNILDGWTKINLSTKEYNDSLKGDVYDKYYKEAKEAFKGLKEESSEYQGQVLDDLDSSIEKTKKDIELKTKSLILNRGLRGSEAGQARIDDKKALEELNQSLGFYEAQLQAVEEILGLTEEQRKRETDELNKNTDATDKNTSSKKKKLEAVVGSIKYYENLISLLQTERDRVSTNGREYQHYTDAIIKAQIALSKLNTEIKGLDFKGKGDFESARKEIEDILSRPVEIDGLVEANITDELQMRLDAYRKEQKGYEDLQQSKKEALTEFAYVSTDLINNLFDAKIANYDREIDRNNEYFSKLMSNEEISEEQRDALDKEREKKEKEIERKKIAAQRRQAIFNKIIAIAEIAINTAKSISASAAVGFPAAVGTVAASVALGAVQAAAVAATPIPQYKKGKRKGEGRDGIALLNDGGKDELKISETGEITRIKGRNVLDNVKKSDTIIPDADKFLSNISDEELSKNVHKYAMLANVSNQTRKIDSYLMAKSVNDGIARHTDRLINEMRNSSKRNRTNVNVTTNVSEDLDFLFKLNNTL